jgi:hypothetical protein
MCFLPSAHSVHERVRRSFRSTTSGETSLSGTLHNRFTAYCSLELPSVVCTLKCELLWARVTSGVGRSRSAI